MKHYKIFKTLTNFVLALGGFVSLSIAFEPLAGFGFLLLASYVRFKIATELFERFGEKE